MHRTADTRSITQRFLARQVDAKREQDARDAAIFGDDKGGASRRARFGRHANRSKHQPHQSDRECARRVRQRAAAEARAVASWGDAGLGVGAAE